MLASREEIRINYCLPEVCFMLLSLHYDCSFPKTTTDNKMSASLSQKTCIIMPWLKLAFFLTLKTPLLKSFENIEKSASEEASYYPFRHEVATSKTDSQPHMGSAKKDHSTKTFGGHIRSYKSDSFLRLLFDLSHCNYRIVFTSKLVINKPHVRLLENWREGRHVPL